MHIIFFLGRHPELTFFIRQFISYIEDSACFEDYYVVDVNQPETFNCVAFDEYALQPSCAMFTFNNLGIHLSANDGENFWKKNNIPVFDYLVDHPRNFEDTLLSPPCDIFVFTLDKNHEAFITRFYPQVKGIFFSPNGGNISPPPLRDYSSRTIDVLYMGNCNERVDYYNSIDLLPDKGADLYRSTISYMMQNTMVSAEEAIESYLRDNCIAYSDGDLYNIIKLAAWSIETTVRRSTKLEGMKALSDSGVNVDIYGTGWSDESYPFRSNIKIHERIDPVELMSIIDNAKISLCFIPWFKRGCSEKVFNSMLHGSICVTDKSEYLAENYKNWQNIVYFNLNSPHKMAEAISVLLNNPSKAEQIAINGYKTALLFDSWSIRYENVANTIEKELR